MQWPQWLREQVSSKEFKSCFLLVVQPSVSYATSLCLGFLTEKWGNHNSTNLLGLL